MTIGQAISINVLLRSLTNEDETPWEEMEKAGADLADRAHRVLQAGHDAASFRAALNKGQGFPQKRQRKGRANG